MNAHWWAGFALALALAAFGAPAAAVPAQTLVARAAEDHARGDHAGAARALEELRAGGFDSADVLYDLGTVYTLQERYGDAVWCFEQVARRSPFAFAAARNLRATRVRLARRDAARSGRAVVETQPPVMVQVGEILPFDWAVPLVVLAEVLALGAWRARRRAVGETARVGATVALVLAAMTAGFGLVVVAARQTSAAAGIVRHDALRLLQMPRPDGIPDEPVREGERVEVVRHEGEYVRVRTPEGRAGWLDARDVGELTE